MSMIKKIVGIALLLGSPMLALAASDDVTLTTDVTITIGSQNYTVTGSSATLSSIVVNSSTAVLTLEGGSSAKITSSDRSDMSHDASGTYVTQKSCNSSESSITFAVPSDTSGTVDITVTPTGTPCSSGGYDVGFSSTLSAPAPSGGGVVTPTVTTPTVTTPTVTTPAVTLPEVTATAELPSVTVIPPAPAAKVAISAEFNVPLQFGKSHPDVKRLQQLLNSDFDTMVALSGVGSAGNETDYFGPATRRAVEKFQLKHGVAKSGDVGFGNFGPATRAKMARWFGWEASTNPPTPQARSNVERLELIKQLLEQIAILQAQLAAL